VLDSQETRVKRLAGELKAAETEKENLAVKVSSLEVILA
jgi:hypothetical protein